MTERWVKQARFDPFSLKAGLEKIRSAGLFRARRTLDSAQGATISIGGARLVNFCSNDYLGLANDARLVEAMQSGAAAYGVGSGASQLVCGRSRAHEQLEEAISARLGRSRAVIFSSGYLANLAVISTFAARRDDVVVMDKANHASLIDGALLARASLRRYAHNDIVGLERILRSGAGRRALVATDSVFSMDGDIAALPDIVAACEQHNALLAVDDAHGFGVLGQNGAGSLEYFSLDEARVPILMATFTKACGVMGAFVAGPDEIIETIIQSGRPYIYTTAIPAALAVAAEKALTLVAQETWRREKLYALIDRFVQGARQLGLPLSASTTPIQGFITGSAEAAVACSDYAMTRGILINAIRAPTVPKNTERLRITLTAGHSSEQVDRLLGVLAELAGQLKQRAET